MSRRGNHPVPKRLKKIVEFALEHGWTYDTSGTEHPRLTPPPGTLWCDGTLAGPVSFALTPSDSARGDKNSVARLRRAGLDVPRHF